MINLPDATSIRAALNQPLEPQLHELLAKRFADATACELADMTHILVIQPGDTATDIIAAIGFSPIDAVHDWYEQHPGYHEWIFCVGNGGFAFLVFVQDAEGVLSNLLRLCRNEGTGLCA